MGIWWKVKAIKMAMRFVKWVDPLHIWQGHGVNASMRVEARHAVLHFEKRRIASAEYKRNEAYARLKKAFPDHRKRIVAMAIELAVEEVL